MTAAAETGLFLDGLRCAGCVGRVERILRETPGVEDASVNYTTARAWVAFDPDRTDPEALAAEVDALGYSAVPYDPALIERPTTAASRDALVRLLVAAFLAGNVMVVSAALYIGAIEGMDPATRQGLRWLAIGLSVPAVGWCALPFWRGAVSGLRRGELPVDVLVVLGISIALLANVAGTLSQAPDLYVDSASMIVFLILLGRTLEGRARTRAAGAVERLATLTPPRALRVAAAGIEEVPVAALRAGDRVRVPVGEVVPADGRLVAGSSEFDEALLTGEARPVPRRSGEAVTGGTRNLLAEIEVEVLAGVADGTLARLSALLERAQAERPQIQRVADRVAAVFAPVVLLIAAITAIAASIAGQPLLETALTSAAVLIVACPCALGLATPAAVTAALGRAAALGVLVKSGEVLERCAAVDVVVLDKTGTLTEGRLRVAAVVADPSAAAVAGSPRSDEDAVLALAAAAEGSATHPLARAIRAQARQRGLAPEALDSRVSLAGRGVQAGEGSDRVRVGTPAWLGSEGVRVGAALREQAEKLAERGLSLAAVSRGDVCLGVIACADPLRVDAAATVERLRAWDLDPVLVSGDHSGAVAQAAAASGIGRWRADQAPEAKVAWVESLRRCGHRPLVVGDGVNDAAALAAGHVGIAMASGSDVALHAADAVIRAPRLGAVTDLVGLSRSTLARIRENLGFALLYNATAIPLAASGWLSPLLAAVAMSLSSLVVTGNAVRLLRWRPGAAARPQVSAGVQ